MDQFKDRNVRNVREKLYIIKIIKVMIDNNYLFIHIFINFYFIFTKKIY